MNTLAQNQPEKSELTDSSETNLSENESMVSLISSFPNHKAPHNHIGARAFSTISETEAIEFTKYRNALIVGPSDALVMINEGNNYLGCTDSSLLPSVAHLFLVPSVIRCPGFLVKTAERVIEEPVLFLAGGGCRAPYHWFHDALTRLVAFESTGESARILIPSRESAPPFIEESLRLLGLEDKIEYISPNERVRAKEVWVSEDLFPNSEKLNACLRIVRSRLLTAVGCDPSLKLSMEEGRNVYISRQGSINKRDIENGTEVKNLAVKFGFEEWRFENLSLTEQIKLMAQTTRVFAPHGAGLFNTLYMPGGSVVELFPINHLGEDTNAPCWSRIIDVHAAEGRSIFWSAIESQIIEKDTVERDVFSILGNIEVIESILKNPCKRKNCWIRRPITTDDRM